MLVLSGSKLLKSDTSRKHGQRQNSPLSGMNAEQAMPGLDRAEPPNDCTGPAAVSGQLTLADAGHSMASAFHS